MSFHLAFPSYTGIPPTEAAITDAAKVNPAVLTRSYTPELYPALRSAILTGESATPVRLTEETYSAMLDLETAVGCWPVYDLKSDERACAALPPDNREQAPAAFCSFPRGWA